MSSEYRNGVIKNCFFSCYSADFIVRKLEEKVGIDLNGDGRIGGPGMTSQLEQATHIDFNRDGVIGYRPPPGGGKALSKKI